VRRYEFNRYWAQVVVSYPVPAGKSILALRSYGREAELGQHLTEDQRAAMAQTLRQQLRNRR